MQPRTRARKSFPVVQHGSDLGERATVDPSPAPRSPIRPRSSISDVTLPPALALRGRDARRAPSRGWANDHLRASLGEMESRAPAGPAGGTFVEVDRRPRVLTGPARLRLEREHGPVRADLILMPT